MKSFYHEDSGDNTWGILKFFKRKSTAVLKMDHPTSDTRTKWNDVLLYLLPFILILIFFSRLFFPKLSLFMIPDFGESDVLHFHLPLKELLSQSLKAQEWPVWTSQIANGFPVLAEGQIGTFFIPNLILYRFFPTIIAYNLNLIIIFLILYSGSLLFLRSLEFSKISSVFTATLFTFCGYFSVHLNHYDLIQTSALLPYIFWSSYRLWKKPSLGNAIIFAFLLSQQIFAGYINMVLITAVGISIFIAGLLIKEGRHKILIRFFWFLSGIFFALCFSMIQILPTVELWRLSSKSGGLDYEITTQYPYPVQHLISFIKPYAFGNPAIGTYPRFSENWGIFWENTAYIGVPAFIFAIFSVFFIRNFVVRIFLSLAVISIILVLGKSSPFYFVFTLPPFNFFRVPSKYLLLTGFALSVLAGFVLDKIISGVRKRVISDALYHLSLFLITGILITAIADEFIFSYHYPPATPAEWWLDKPQTVSYISNKSTKITTVAAPAVWNDIFLKKGWQDFTPYRYLNNTLYENANILWGINQTDLDMGGLIPRRLSYYLSAVENPNLDTNLNIATISAEVNQLLTLSSVNYLVSPYRIDGENFKKIGTVNPSDGTLLSPISVYENQRSMPEIYITFNSKQVTTVEDFFRMMGNKSLSASLTVAVEDPSLIISHPDKKIKAPESIHHDKNNTVIITDSDSDGILVLPATNYPGWTAMVDNRPVPVNTVNLYQQGILLPKGKHSVEVTFGSPMFDKGKLITELSWLIISSVFVLTRVFSHHKAGYISLHSQHRYNRSGN